MVEVDSHSSKRVTFASGVKLEAPTVPEPPNDVNVSAEPQHIGGVIGQLEIYRRGGVKIRLHNGTLFDVSVTDLIV